MQKICPLERRQAPRTSLISGARFVADGTVQRCVVVDISAGGVCLYLLEEREAPERVVVHLPDGLIRPARWRWQRGTQVGYAFDEASPSSSSDADPPCPADDATQR
jgi:hypothetical protein